MKCDKCFNHGFRFNVSSNHRNTCPLSNCQCLKCQIVAQKSDNNSNGVTATSEEAIAGPSGESCSKSVENCPKLEDNPLKAVQDLAQKLSKYEISTEDLETCVLYAVLKNNDLDINEAKRQLCESRTAIAESLVSSYFGTERDSSHKRTRSPSPVDNQKSKSLKEFCPLKQTAKKSFPNNGTKVQTDRTRSQKSISNKCFFIKIY